jgi:plasmid stabilization system protein ParE
MTYTVVLRQRAEKAIDRAAGWYEDRNPHAARAFLDAIDAALAKIVQNPQQFAMLKHKLRRAIVTGFPYSVLFRVVGTELIVTNCVHFRRHPRHWRTD